METSPTSCQSKDTFGIPVVPPSPRMSKDDMRWSEMVPPNSALTFAVILDDELDPIAFSGAELLRTRNSLDRTKSVDGPLDVTDGHSQILSVLARSSNNPLSTIEPRTATLAYFQDAHGDLFHDSTPSTQRVNFTDNHNRPLDTRTQTSSTLEGLDVYLRGSLLEKAHGSNRHFSCFDGLEDDFAFDPRTSFDNRYAHVFDDTGRGDTKQMHQQFEEEEVIDEGFSETPLINARPRLPTRTTSKASKHSAHPSPSKLRRPSNSTLPNTFHASPITTQSPQLPPILTSDDVWRWSAIGTPTDPEALSSLRFATQSEAQRRRLRKTRTTGLDGTFTPSSPDETTSRSPSEFNRRQIASPAEPAERRSVPAAPDVVLRRGFYNHQLPSVRESELVIHNSPQGHWTAPKQLSKRDALLHQPKSPLPFPGVPLATTIAPKVVRGLSNTYKHIKSSVQPEKDGWVYVDVKTEIKVKQRNV